MGKAVRKESIAPTLSADAMREMVATLTGVIARTQPYERGFEGMAWCVRQLVDMRCSLRLALGEADPERGGVQPIQNRPTEAR